MKDHIHLLAGTYASGKDNGIHVFRFDQNTGESENIGKIEADNPTYFVSSRNGKYIYSVLENEETPSYVNAFTYNKSKEELSQIDSIVSGDDGSCYITMDKDNKHIITANYGGGSISIFDIDANGQFYKMSQLIVFEGKSIDPERQTQSHIHCVEFSPNGRFLFATDLGTDKIYQMEIDYECNQCEKEFIINKTIKNIEVTRGSGPRHIKFHPTGKYFYVINELSDTIITFTYNDGEISQIQEIPVVTNKAGGSADIVITPDGKFLYASVRLKEDGIAIFSINAKGMLEKIDYQSTGIHPRNLRITPNGKYLLTACRDNSRIEIYKINQDNGLLENIKKDIHITEPACLKFI
ncbi:MAG: lactonase family protein [Dysgonomonas sp.]|nr:lactonase family protein [Dysgonomonas sp.]